VAGQRWRIEESFQAGKGLCGLDEHQVRRWTSWHRWTTLAMLTHAFLAVTTAHRTRPVTSNGRADRAHRQRVPPTLRCPPARHRSHDRHPAGLVTMAPTTPSPSPRMPLPMQNPTMITNYGCSTRSPSCTLACPIRCISSLVLAPTRPPTCFLSGADRGTGSPRAVRPRPRIRANALIDGSCFAATPPPSVH
jgi:hypothetical protein